MARRLFLLAALLLIVPAASFADTVDIGYISFDPFEPGLNVFNISNLTGPGSPVKDLLSFSGITLTLNTVLNGSYPIDTDPLTVADFEEFYSVVFTATLSNKVFELLDGSIFTADLPTFSTTLSPSGGNTTLMLGDIALFTISGTSVPPSGTAVPEPSSVLLLVTGLIALIALNTRSRRNPRPQCINGI